MNHFFIFFALSGPGVSQGTPPRFARSLISTDSSDIGCFNSGSWAFPVGATLQLQLPAGSAFSCNQVLESVQVLDERIFLCTTCNTSMDKLSAPGALSLAVESKEVSDSVRWWLFQQVPRLNRLCRNMPQSLDSLFRLVINRELTCLQLVVQFDYIMD